MTDFVSRLRLKAVDGISGTLNRVSKNFRVVSREANRASIKFKQFQKRTEAFRKTAAKVGGNMKSAGRSMSMGLTAPIVGAGAYVLKASADFEKGMNKVRALAKLEKGSAGFEKLRQQAKDLGSSTQYSASQVADAMGFLGMAGWDAAKIYEGIPGLLSLAAASGTELGRAADITSNIMGAFTLEASQAGNVADILATVTASANVDMEMLAESMKYAAPVAKDFGMNLGDTAAAIGVLGNVGIQGSMAGNSLKAMLTNLAAPTSGARKMLKGLGIQVEAEGGKIKNFGDVMGQFSGKLQNMSKADQMKALKEILGKRAMVSGTVLAKSVKSGEFQKLANDLKDVTGNAGRMASTMNEGATGGLVKLKSATEGLAIAIGDSGVLEAFTKIIEKVTSFVSWLSTSSPAILKWGSIFAVVVAAIGPVVWIVGSFISMLPAIITGVGLLSSAFGVLSAATLPVTLPILGIIAAIAALIGIGVVLYRNWTAIKEFFVSVWNSPLAQLFLFITGIKALIFVVKNLLWPAIKWVGGAIADVFTTVVETVGKVVRGIFNGMNFIAKGLKSILPKGVSDIIFGEDKATPQAAPTRAAQAKQNFVEQRTQTNNARVGVDFTNLPMGTNVTKQDDGGVIDFSLGFMGAA